MYVCVYDDDILNISCIANNNDSTGLFLLLLLHFIPIYSKLVKSVALRKNRKKPYTNNIIKPCNVVINENFNNTTIFHRYYRFFYFVIKPSS